MLKLINPLDGDKNCRACAVAVDHTLGGNPSSARLIPAGSAAAILRFYPGKTFRPKTFSGIVEEIAQAGPGARGIVIGSRGRNAHAFNVVYIEGDAVLLDGQTGHAKNLGYWARFQFMRTK